MSAEDEFVDLVFKLQNLWAGIDGRCNRPRHTSYKDYGAKGITLCKEWSGRKGMVKFVKWCLANGYRQGLTIDRIKTRKGYSPSNCRFVTHRVNCWNKTNNRMLTYLGETKCSAEWSHDPRCVVHPNQFQQRINAGWDVKRALTQPLRTVRNGKNKDCRT